MNYIKNGTYTLAEMLVLTDRSSKQRVTSLKKVLIEDGYTVEDKRIRIQGKRPQVSIITK